MKRCGSVRIVYGSGKTIEVKRTSSYITVTLQEKGTFKSQNFPAKEGTTVEIAENFGNVLVKLRPSRGQIKMEMMKF